MNGVYAVSAPSTLPSMRKLTGLAGTLAAAIALPLVLPFALGAQVVDLTVHDNGIAIGDKPRVNGVRINFRDRYLEHVNGVNLTLWSPYEPARGRVSGL